MDIADIRNDLLPYVRGVRLANGVDGYEVLLDRMINKIIDDISFSTHFFRRIETKTISIGTLTYGVDSINAIRITDVIGDDGITLLPFFRYISQTIIRVKDPDFEDNNNGEKLDIEFSIYPSISEITNNEYKIILPALIEGVKYFSETSIDNLEQTQVANIKSQRYFLAKQNLINSKPFYGEAEIRNTRIAKWI